MKTCCNCKQDLPESAFHKKKGRKDGIQGFCRLCAKKQFSAWYKQNRQQKIAQNAARRKRIYQEQLAKTDLIKSAPCTDCGRVFFPWQMDFDHRPGTEKLNEVSTLLGEAPWSVIEAEIAKCDVVCACCHRHRTHIRKQNLTSSEVSGNLLNSRLVDG